MGDNSSIEWTDATWNPVRGCSIVSKGCTNCYAMRQAHRSSGAGGAYEGLTKLSNAGPVWTGEVRTVPSTLLDPKSWKRPRRIFVNSMSDLFHEGIPDDYIRQVWTTMADCQQHIFQILTKRPQRMRDYLRARLAFGNYIAPPLPNVWLGVSVEDQAAAEERIPALLDTPAAVRWISAEPLLGPVDIFSKSTGDLLFSGTDPFNPGSIDWIVAGGESGPGARPMHPDWARSLRDQCAVAHDGVPFFFKQWGSWFPRTDCYSDGAARDNWCSRAEYRSGVQLLTIGGHEWCVGDPAKGGRHDGQPPSGTWVVQRLDKKTSGRELDGRTHDEYPCSTA